MIAAQLSFPEAPARRSGREVVVLPDAARAEERLTRLARRDGLVVGDVVFTLAQLERELVAEARRAGACRAAATPYQSQLALHEAAREHTPVSSPFHRVRNEPGYAEALGGLLAALLHGRLDPADLAGLDVPPRVRELGRTLAAARGLLDGAGVCEPAAALTAAVEALQRGLPLPRKLTGVGLVEFDGILDWTPLRLALVSALAGRVPVRVRLPWSADRPELTEALEPALRAFEAMPQGAAPELELDDPAAGPLAPFLRRLFAASGAPAGAPVQLVSCATPAAQAREVAHRCADLVAEGVAPDRIAVAVRSLGGGAAEELAAALERLGLPWRERRGRPALPAPPVRLALHLLRLAEDSIPREGLAELLCSQLVWLDGDGERLPAHAVAQRLRRSGAVDDATEGGYAVAFTRLAARGRGDERELAAVEEAGRRVLRLVAAVRALPERATLREHAAALLSLLRAWGVPRRLRRPERGEADAPLSRAAAAALGRDQAALRALEDAAAGLAAAAASLGIGGRAVSRADWARLLSGALSEASLPPGGARGGAVQLVELRELAGRDFDHVLLAGLVDGELPARPAADPLLSDDDRRAVNRAARRPVFRATLESDALLLPPRQAEEPLLFQLGLGAARAGVALFWPRADDKGRELLRSPFVDEIARALGRPEANAETERVALQPIPPAARCRSRGELLSRVALDALADPAYRVSPPAAAEEARRLFAAAAASPLRDSLSGVVRAAQAERERVRVFIGEIAPARFSGQLSGSALAAVGEKFAFGRAAPLSAGQLEDYATCAFRTLGKKVLRLEPDDELDDQLGPRERGDLLHRCLERFFRRMIDEQRLPLRADEHDLAILRQEAASEMDLFAREQHVGRRVLWEMKRGELLEQLDDIVRAQKGCAPRELERRFGYDEPGSWPPLVLADEAEEVFLRGKIDRIDEGGVVLDYKSSDLPRLRQKTRRLLEPEFQLLVYAAMQQQQHPGSAPDVRYFSLKDARATERLAGLDEKLAALPAAVFEQVRLMRAGRFEARPLSCDYCSLKPACRLVSLPTDPDENGGEVKRG